MHVAPLIAPKSDGEDHTKDIDFTSAGIRARCLAGRADTKRMLERAPWKKPVDPICGVGIHDPVAPSELPLADGVSKLSARPRHSEVRGSEPASITETWPQNCQP